jgi:hypothetical protein
MTGGVVAIAIGVFVVVLVTLVVVTRVRARARWRERMDATLREMGLEVHSLEPTVRASGGYRGLELAVEGAHTFAGTTAIFATRIVVIGGNPPATAVQRVGVGGAPSTMKAVLTGDVGFDARYRVYAGTGAEGLWRDADRRAQLLALGGSAKVGELIELRCEEGRVTATLAGVRLPPETLRAGINLACGMVAG